MKGSLILNILRLRTVLLMSKIFFGHKLSARSDKCRFIEYLKKINGYCFNHPTEQKVFVSRHTTFLKHKFIQEGGSGRNIEFMKVHDLQTDPEIPVVGYQKYPRMRYIYYTHLLSESQSASSISEI